ncbi:MAG TPA: CHAD domain-containing protein [Phototrophicaceae bacterium]|jgi:CHAD domain-containing protein|nr:CHAD domain-containing protein [Phototrophicaceae bacterium]
MTDMEAGPYSLVDDLKAVVTPVEQEDTMAEAGRKILVVDFIKILQNESGSRLGDDIENVHDMRVATRRTRSALRLLEGYYKSSVIHPFMENLKLLGKYLGAVRDLDVLILDLQRCQAELNDEGKAAIQPTVDQLDKKRRKARKKLINLLDSDQYNDFVHDYTDFLTHSGAGAKQIDPDVIEPYQVRHVIPGLLHEHLAAVRAYDNVIESASPSTLHALRIEFKRLRYATSFFHEVLGNTGDDFIGEIKTIQDHLGRTQDITVAQEYLNTMIEDGAIEAEVLQTYLAELQAETEKLETAFPAVWQRFNTRSVQSKLSNALLALR